MDNQEYEYAGFWIRVLASLIDTALILMIVVPLTILVYGDLIWEDESFVLGAADFLINYVAPFITVTLFWFYKSATPGKMALNIKIVNAKNGKPMSVGQILGRYVAYIPAALVFMIGIIWVAFDSKKQGWHDKLAGTVVIKKKRNRTIVEFDEK